MMELSVLIGKWPHFKELISGNNLESVMQYGPIEMWRFITIKLKFTRTYSMYYIGPCVMLLDILGLVGLSWGFKNSGLLDYNLNRIMDPIRTWRLLGTNKSDVYQHADRGWWSAGLPSLGVYLITVSLWWQWDFEATILMGIFKPVSSGSKEQYKYFYI